MGKYEVLTLFLKVEQLLDQIQMSGKTCDERDAEEQEDGPYFVLNTEPTPPGWR
jgi:hypothetical protein